MLNGTVISIDALHVLNELFEIIVEDKKGHYLVGVKDNRATLKADILAAFASPTATIVDLGKTIGKEHGRIEERSTEAICFVGTNVFYPHMHTAMRVTRKIQHRRGGTTYKTSNETAIYITSLSIEAIQNPKYANLVRGHWSIENRLHHIKDRTMKEDRCRARAAVGTNLATLRSTVVLSMLRNAKGKHMPQLQARIKANVNVAIDFIMSKNSKNVN